MLTIAISTFSDRISVLETWRWDPRVDYLVLWQGNEGLPEPNLPSAVRVVRLPTKGVAKSRNRAIALARTEWLWFMDDDVVIPQKSIDTAETAISSPGSVRVFIGTVLDPTGEVMKSAPNGARYGLLKVLKVGTIQILCHRPTVLDSGAWFPEEMGAGAPYPACDEPVFLARILKGSKAEIQHLDGMRVVHPRISSGQSLASTPLVRARALAFREIWGAFLGPLASLAFGIKNIHRLGFRFIHLTYWKKLENRSTQ